MNHHQSDIRTPPGTFHVPLATFSRALDEIYVLRAGAAHEVVMIREMLDYNTLPVGVRDRLAKMMIRLGAAARGEWDEAWHDLSPGQRQEDLIDAGARPLLTRDSWEKEQL